MASRVRLGVQAGKEEDDRHFGVLSTSVGQQFQRIRVGQVDPGDDQVDPASVELPNRVPVVGSLVDLVTEQLEHRSQEREDRRFGMNNEDAGLTHGFNLSEEAADRASRGREVILEGMRNTRLDRRRRTEEPRASHPGQRRSRQREPSGRFVAVALIGSVFLSIVSDDRRELETGGMRQGHHQRPLPTTSGTINQAFGCAVL